MRIPTLPGPVPSTFAGTVFARTRGRPTRARITLTLTVLLLTACAPLALAPVPATSQTPALPPPPGLEPGDGLMTMALTGDAIITRRLSPYTEPQFLAMIELIRDADMAFVNLEMLFHDYEPFPMHSSGGTYMRGDPALAHELVWAGFDMASMANNHTGDWGVEGMRLTKRYAEEAGLVTAGAGESLWEAREARFLETPDGRVALISLASTFTDHSVAGRERGGIRARPGLSPLRHREWEVVSPERLERIRRGMEMAGFRTRTEGDTLWTPDGPYVAGDPPLGAPPPEEGDWSRERSVPHPGDLAEVEAVVRSARELADYVIVTIHAHESGEDRSEPAEFIEIFSRAVIDAGADVMVGHGPHVLRGIEIHRGKPILYSLGDFMFQNETLLRLPGENYERYDLGDEAHVSDFNRERYDGDTRGFPTNREIWESVVAVPVWRDGALQELRLYPITLGFGEDRTVRGRPLFADRGLGRKILQDLVERSAPYGTTIEIEDGVGVIRLGGGR